jgi:hypothetical protein
VQGGSAGRAGAGNGAQHRGAREREGAVALPVWAHRVGGRRLRNRVEDTTALGLGWPAGGQGEARCGDLCALGRRQLCLAHGGQEEEEDAWGARAGSSNRGTRGRERQQGKRRLHNL